MMGGPIIEGTGGDEARVSFLSNVSLTPGVEWESGGGGVSLMCTVHGCAWAHSWAVEGVSAFFKKGDEAK